MHGCPTSALQDWKLLDTLSEAQRTQGIAYARHVMEQRDTPSPKNARRGSGTSFCPQRSLPVVPEECYDGPQLGWPLKLQDILDLMVHYSKRRCTPLWEGSLCRILSESTSMFEQMPPVTWISSRSGHHERLVVVGDLHGQLSDLLTILMEYGLPAPDGPQYLFNGDFVDRGIQGVEVVTLLLALKLLHPDSVHLNRGNHESEGMNAVFGFLDEVNKKYSGTMLFQMFAMLWNVLPLATVIDDAILVVHGGLFRTSGVTLNQINTIPKEDCTMDPTALHEKLLCDILWSDPTSQPGRCEGSRGAHTIKFGPDVTRTFLERNQLKLLVRSHQVPPSNAGFEWFHDHRLVTVFSASNYCGSAGNAGGVLVLEEPGVIRCEEFMATPLVLMADHLRPIQSALNAKGGRRAKVDFLSAKEADDKARHMVVKSLQDAIRRKHGELSAFWQAKNEACPGHISREDWLNGLTSQIGLPVNWSSYEADLWPGDPADATVNWQAFLDRYQLQLSNSGWASKLQEDLQERLVAQDIPLSSLFKLFNEFGPTGLQLADLQRELGAVLGLELTLTQMEHLAALMWASEFPLTIATILKNCPMRYAGRAPPVEVKAIIVALERVLSSHSGEALAFLAEVNRDSSGRLGLAEVQRLLDWLGSSTFSEFTTPGLAQVILNAFGADISRDTVDLLDFLSNFTASPDRFLAHSQAEALVQDIARALYAHEGSLRVLFTHLDSDGDGYLTAAELEDALSTLVSSAGLQLTAGQLALVTRHVDLADGGRISCHAFLRAFQVQEEEEEVEFSTPTRMGWASRLRKVAAAMVPSSPLGPKSPTVSSPSTKSPPKGQRRGTLGA
eukprot:GGOE01004878.1.p1 GENE.GGOE01004878.1~~GGOE01004878.1.p1  ORF type:complete len:975 (-),score=220.51 GGOE01004878.1:384-2909(-)